MSQRPLVDAPLHPLHPAPLSEQQLPLHGRPRRGASRCGPLGQERRVSAARRPQPAPEVAEHLRDAQKLRRRRLAHVHPGAAPRKLPRPAHLPYAHWVQVNVATQLKQVGILVDKQRLVASLKEVAGAAVPAIEVLRVGAAQLPHGARQVGVRGRDQQMVVVAHEHISMQPQAMAMNDAGQALQEARAIALIAVDRLALITARRDVVEGPRKLHSKWPRHTGAVL